MSTFEPLTEDALQEIAGNCATETSVLARVVATALHHLARANVAEAERDDAQARVRELEATTTAATIRDVHKALGAAPGQSVVTRAEEVMGELARLREGLDADDCAPGLEMPGDASLCWVLTRPEVQAALRLVAQFDRPSPGDDITREALDALDSAR